jgi:hypothetical protein
MKKKIIKYWDEFWYDYHPPMKIKYGGSKPMNRVLRKQRLFNVVLVIVLIIIHLL